MIVGLITGWYWSKEAKKDNLKGSEYGVKAFFIYFGISILSAILLNFIAPIAVSPVPLLGIPISLILTGKIMRKKITEDAVDDDGNIKNIPIKKGEYYTTDSAKKYSKSKYYKYKIVKSLTDEMKANNKKIDEDIQAQLGSGS